MPGKIKDEKPTIVGRFVQKAKIKQEEKKEIHLQVILLKIAHEIELQSYYNRQNFAKTGEHLSKQREFKKKKTKFQML